MSKIGVFDSGVGGQSVVDALRLALPDHEILYAEDKENVPYGTKTPQQLKELVVPILRKLQSLGCEVIVIACNTVTTNIITELRETLDVPLIGMEPMIKPAAEETVSGIIAVCATPATLRSERYMWLKKEYAKDVQVLEPDCSDWASLIEMKRIDKAHIHDQINAVCDAGADVIVLGCTHYHWIQDIIDEETKGRAKVIQPESAIIEQVKRVLSL